eukprot:5320697-Amphidinium_carterae.1
MIQHNRSSCSTGTSGQASPAYKYLTCARGADCNYRNTRRCNAIYFITLVVCHGSALVVLQRQIYACGI